MLPRNPTTPMPDRRSEVVTGGPTLVEYETTRLELGEGTARRLAATGFVSVSPSESQGFWDVSAGEYVGSLTVDGLQLLIRPKIEPENLFVLLEVGLPSSAWQEEAFSYASDWNLLPAVVSLFARTVETTLARGLYRSYSSQQEQLVALRGRIDLTDVIRRGGMAAPIGCQFDEFTPDVAENRILKAAIRRCLRVPGVASLDRRRLMQQLVALEEVTDGAIGSGAADRINFTRLNAHYQPPVRLASLVLENLTLVDQRGGTVAPSFMVSMNKLFERFVTERLRRALLGRLEVRAEPPVHLGLGNQVRMRPDLEFRKRGTTVYVGDIKYKLTGDARARNADQYQLLAYTTAMDLPEGVLIYCLAEGGQPSRAITVRHSGKVLHTLAVDLGGSPVEIDAELNRVADWIVGRTQ